MGTYSRVAVGVLLGLVVGLMLASAPARAQFSDSYNFLKAVRDKDAYKAQTIMSQPGSTIVNTRDPQSGEMAMHIVTRRRDLGWMGFLLNAGAEVDPRDRFGNTPLILAAENSFADGVRLLLQLKADVNAINARGETALIKAVQVRDIASVRQLLQAGADPAMSDHVAGMSARDYAEQDRHGSAVLRLIEEAPAKPKASGTIGPKLGG
jgi:hypothetical protein